MEPKNTTETAVKALIAKNNQFLLVKQTVDGKTHYTLPGGRAIRKNLEQELVREVKEETGLEVHVEQYLGRWFFRRKSDNVKTRCKTYLCKPTTDILTTSNKNANEKIEDFLWLDKDEFLKGDYTKNEGFLKLIQKTEINI